MLSDKGTGPADAKISAVISARKPENASKVKSFLELIKPFQNKPCLSVCSTGLLKTLGEKEKLLVTSNFSFSHSVFHLFAKLSASFIKFELVICKVFQFGRV